MRMTRDCTHFKKIDYIDSLPFTAYEVDLGQADFIVIGHERYERQLDGGWKRIAHYVIEDK